VPKGGDRRPIQRPEDLEYAAILMHAMCIDESEAGVQFNCEREALLQRWQRLTSFLNVYESHGWGLPPNSLADFDKYFNHLIHPLPVAYPKPRPLTQAELRNYDFRKCASEEALEDIYAELQPQYLPGPPQEADTRYREVTTYLSHWVKQIIIDANPQQKPRRSSRSTVKQYLREVQDFCLRWHLDAWWVGFLDHIYFLVSELSLYQKQSLLTPG
jgi:hypothetical protein